MNLLVDTNVFIDFLRGMDRAKEYFLKHRNDSLFCSVITIAELWAGVRPLEEAGLEGFLSGFRSVSVEDSMARQAGKYMQQFAKSHHLLLPDALIAAAARHLQASLVTHNVKHFPMKDVRVFSPYSL